MVITEHNVADQIRARNEKAIAFLIETYGGLLSAIIRRHVRDDEREVEECLDDVLLAVWQHIDEFDGSRSTLKQWMAAIAKYRAIDYQRRIIKNRQRFVRADITDELYGKPPPPASSERDLEEVLAHLSPEERSLFEKYYLEGVPSREMAERMNVKESWIHNKLSRGRKKLRKMFIPENEV